MKSTISLAALAALFVVAGTGFAAPIVSLRGGDSLVGRDAEAYGDCNFGVGPCGVSFGLLLLVIMSIVCWLLTLLIF